MGKNLEQKVELRLSDEDRALVGIVSFQESDSDSPLPLQDLSQAARVNIDFPTREQPNFSMVCASWKSDIQKKRLEFLVKEKDNELANITFKLSESDQRLLKSVTKKGVWAKAVAARELISKNEIRLKSSEIKLLNQ